MQRNFFIVVFVMLSVFAYVVGAGAGESIAPEEKIITDMCDRTVSVPVSPQRIACMHCVSPEKIMTLGKGDLIRLMAKQSPWAYKLFPEIRGAQSNRDVTPRQMLDMRIDVVLYTPGMTKGEKYSAAGLKTACAFSAATRPMNLDAYMENFTRQVSFFGDLLGPDAKARAERYNRYFDKKVRQIMAVTAKIDKKDRPAVYYGGLRSNMLSTQGKGSVMHWNTEVSGGAYLPEALEDNHAKATMEQVVSWNPDIILLSGLCNSTELVTKNPDWASLDAVKNGRVYLLPQGVYTWDHASNESVLLMIYLARIFYPDRFKDWDMLEEMKTFYRDVYEREVSDEDLRRILNHMPPA